MNPVYIFVEIILLLFFLFGQACSSNKSKALEAPLLIPVEAQSVSQLPVADLNLISETPGAVDAKVLDIRRAEITKMKNGQNTVGRLSFTIEPAAQFVEYEICTLETHDDPSCSNLAALCSNEEKPVCENLRSYCKSEKSFFGCKTSTSYTSPVEISDLPPGRYDVKVRACVTELSARSAPCGAYRELSYIQDDHLDPRQWAYLHLQGELLEQIPILANEISENLRLFVSKSHEEQSCQDAPDYLDLSYAAGELDENKIRAALQFYASEVILSGRSNDQDRSLRTQPFLRLASAESLEEQIPIPNQSIVFASGTFAMQAPKNMHKETLRNLIDKRVSSAGKPKILEYDSRFAWQMTDSVLLVNEKVSKVCQARQSYNTYAQLLRSKIQSLKSQLSIIQIQMQQPTTIPNGN